MNKLTVYDHCEQDTWAGKIAADINPVPADSYQAYNTTAGLVVLNSSSKEMGGGLVAPANDYPVPAGAKYFGFDVEFLVSGADLPYLGRNEIDLKITHVSAGNAPIPNQANGSAQQNASKAWMWQLDPTGTGWVDSGYAPGQPRTDSLNTMQFRFWSDGKHWSVTGLRMNLGTPFVPGAPFQNLPMIATTWGAGLHPQLQMEVLGAPWFLRQTYTRIRISAGDAAIPWEYI
jgi:hypothetical protein